MGSLMDGIEVSSAKQKAAKAEASSAESTKTIKLVVAIIGLLVGGALIAWNLGLFGHSADSAIDKKVPPEVAAAPTSIGRQAPPPTSITNNPSRPPTSLGAD